MLNRQSLSLLGVTAALMLSSTSCALLDDLLESDDEVLERLRDEREANDRLATLNADRTATAQASITPSVTPIPTATPTPTVTPAAVTHTPIPTSTPEPTTLAAGELPAALFSVRDGGGDTYLCETGEPVNDPPVDIIEVTVIETQDGLLVLVEFDDPADLTYANDWSFSTNLAFASPGETVYTIMKNEIHDGVVSKGILDETGKNILLGTENFASIDEQGNVTFLIPRETTFMQIASFNTPTEDLPPEQIRCDLAPNDGTVYTIQSHP